MKLNKKKFPYLYSKDVKWYLHKDFEGKEIPLTNEGINDLLHDKNIERDYFSIPMLDKHWDLFNEVYLHDVKQHWQHFKEDNYINLIMRNDGMTSIAYLDREEDQFKFIFLKEFAIAGFIFVSGIKPKQKSFEIADYYFSDMLSEEERNNWKHILLNTFRVSYCIKHFAPIETKIVYEKNRRVKLGKGVENKITADQGIIVPVNIIDSSYLTNIIHIDATAVRGHFRLQPCGAMSLDRKLIWIEPHEKRPYKRMAKKIEE